MLFIKANTLIWLQYDEAAVRELSQDRVADLAIVGRRLLFITWVMMALFVTTFILLILVYGMQFDLNSTFQTSSWAWLSACMYSFVIDALIFCSISMVIKTLLFALFAIYNYKKLKMVEHEAGTLVVPGDIMPEQLEHHDDMDRYVAFLLQELVWLPLNADVGQFLSEFQQQQIHSNVSKPSEIYAAYADTTDFDVVGTCQICLAAWCTGCFPSFALLIDAISELSQNASLVTVERTYATPVVNVAELRRARGGPVLVLDPEQTVHEYDKVTMAVPAQSKVH